MTNHEALALHTATPRLHVVDGRALARRDVVYHRDQPGFAQARITRHDYNACGQRVCSIDPRLHAARSEQPDIEPNLQQRYSLGGRCLRSRSVDAGTTVTLHDACGREAVTWLANGVEQSRHYEAAPLPGRLLSITALGTDGATRTAERWQWADGQPWVRERNLAGHCHTRFDGAGKNVVQSRSLLGSITSECLQLLQGHEESDWSGDDPLAWAKSLEPECSSSSVIVDTCGAIVASEDAKGHRQRHGFDRCGQYRASWVTPMGSTETPVVLDVSYDANGQRLMEHDANGLVTHHTYAPDTLRLVGRKTTRLHDRRVLQDLRYQYDPVGLVTQVRDHAEQTRFWRNQKIEPQQDYQYDSLSQLILASGRQMAALGRPDSLLHALPVDTHAYTLYQRRYTYDQSGNLLNIRHTVPATSTGYTIRLTASARSNRTLLSDLCDDPALIDSHFDAAGQQRAVDGAQRAAWNSRMQLGSVTRDAAGSEHYLYGQHHQRLRKTHAHGSTHYLPGLELQQHDSHALHCINVTEHIGVLHWPQGSPEGLANDQLRYSYTDLLGSHGLEIDGDGCVISREEFFPFGTTSVWACRNQTEASYKTLRYSGKERDNTGLYYYGYRYYQPWTGRWLSADPAGAVDGLNLYAMVRNSPLSAVDDDGRMLRIVVKGGIGAAGIGYEAYKHKDRQSQAPAQPGDASTSGSMGDRRADQVIGKIQRMKDEFSPGQQILNSAKGRAQTADHLAHGQLPGANAVLKGAESVATVVEFSQTGDLSQINKAPLANAVATDAVNGVAHSIKATIKNTQKAVKGAAEVATLSDTKAAEVDASLGDLKEVAQDKLITNVSLGATVKAGLDGAAAVVPHPVAKVGLRILSAAWTVTGVVHGAEELGEIVKTHEDLLVSKTGENLMGQMKTVNASNRGVIMDRVKKSYGFSDTP